jgi:uncharacterized membrane protein YwzB
MNDSSKTTPAYTNRPASVNLKVGVLLLGLVGLVAAALWQLNPPPVVPATAPPTVFSAERAQVDLAVIARQPHPTGSAAIRQVESYLMQQLSQMGLQPQLQTTTAVQVKDEFESVWAGEVRNIVVRIPGTANTRSIVLSAHYDSGPTGPGASDCGSCVVTVLETARALRAGPPLKNDVILVLNNAEEHEMMGSHAFVAEHPWAQNVGLTINFEAQGSRGPAFMYVSSPDNGWLVGEMARVAPYPVAYSFLNNLVGLLAERAGSDLEEFMDGGSPGLGLVYAWNTPAYHTQLDSVPNADLRSIQQEGAYTLAVARHFGNLDLTQPATGQATFFNIWRGVLVTYPSSWAVPLAGLAGVVLVGAVGVGLWRRQLTIGGLVLGCLESVAGLAAAVVFVSLIWWAMKALNSNFQVMLVGTYQSDLYVLGFVLLTIAIAAGLFAVFRTRVNALNLAAGGLVATGLLMVLTTLAMPASSYLFAWPLMAGALGLVWWLWRDRPGVSWTKVAVLLLAAAPAIILIVPLAYMLLPLIGRAEAFGEIPLMGLPMAFVALLLGLLLPQMEALSAWGRWAVPITASGLAARTLAGATVLSGFNEAQPRPDMVAYRLDANAGQAAWLSVDENLDEYTSRFFGKEAEKVVLAPFPSESPQAMLPAWKAPAPVAALPAPSVELRQVSTNGEGATYRLHIRSVREALNMEVTVVAQGEIVTGTVNDRAFALHTFSPDRRNLLRLQYYGVPNDGFDLAFSSQSRLPIVVTVEDRSYGLPNVPGYDLTRPASTMPTVYELSDATVVRKAFQFP